MSLGIKIYADGADLSQVDNAIVEYDVKGFTTNPTLMRQAGVTEYLQFAGRLVRKVYPLPVSLEVFSDDPKEIYRQAHILADIGPNVQVKVPVVSSAGRSLIPSVYELTEDGIDVNVTAVFTPSQADAAAAALEGGPGGIISVFAGRIADTGVDPEMTVSYARYAGNATHQTLWASAREILNVAQATQAGADIITLGYDLLPKLRLLGKDLRDYSIETSRMFLNDAHGSGYEL